MDISLWGYTCERNACIDCCSRWWIIDISTMMFSIIEKWFRCIPLYACTMHTSINTKSPCWDPPKRAEKGKKCNRHTARRSTEQLFQNEKKVVCMMLIVPACPGHRFLQKRKSSAQPCTCVCAQRGYLIYGICCVCIASECTMIDNDYFRLLLLFTRIWSLNNPNGFLFRRTCVPVCPCMYVCVDLFSSVS